MTVALWQRNIKIEEEARLAEERNQERIARDQAEERARIAEETAHKEIERQRTVEKDMTSNQNRPSQFFNTQPLSVAIPASSIWIDTGVDLHRGRVAISATGAWTVWSRVWPLVGPEGHPQSDAIPASDAGRKSWPMPSARNGALVGRIDNGKTFLIESRRTIVVDNPGRLFLTINDALSSGRDNSGSMTVAITYEVWPDSNPCAGYTDNSLASSVTLACLQKVWLDSGCTITGTSYPRDTNSWWSNSPNGTKPVDCDATHTGTQCGAGNYRTIVNDMRAWATSPDVAHRAGCGRFTQKNDFEVYKIESVSENQQHNSSAKNASFNCDQARTASEFSVCNNTDLGQMDKELTSLYRSHLKSHDRDPSITKKLRNTQRTWLTERNRYGSNASCLSARYQERIAWLREFEGTNILTQPQSIKISLQELTSIIWQFGRGDGSIIANIQLRPNGTIGGYSHPNESRWAFENDELLFIGTNGRPTTRYNAFYKENNRWIISGPFQLANIMHILKEVGRTRAK